MEWTHRLAPWRTISTAKAALSGDFTDLISKHRSRVMTNLTAEKSVIGFKRLFRSSNKWLIHPSLAPALVIDRFGAHIRWLSRDPQIRIIHIVRRNNIAWLKSKAFADATGRYAGSRYPDDLRLLISTGEAKRRVAAKIWIDTRLAALSITNPYLRVNYENFVSDNLRVARRIVDFLGCDPHELPVKELKHQPQSASSRATISNLDDVQKALGSLCELPTNG
jgi:hypothetical protein